MTVGEGAHEVAIGFTALAPLQLTAGFRDRNEEKKI
jgi:hypothetical protein